MCVMKVNEKLSILLVLEKTKTSKDGKAPITFRLTVDCKRVELSLGMKINPQKWNQSAGLASGSSIEAMQVNTAINRVKTSLVRHYNILSAQHDYVSAAMVKEAYQGKKPEKRKTILEAFEDRKSKRLNSN